jgi:hypothetical protein
MPRQYVPYPEKHKRPKGFGSLCPDDMPTDAAQALLERAILVPAVSSGKLWAAAGDWCFCAHSSAHEGPEAWHGFPVIGGEVDERVLAELEAQGLITARQRRQLRRQRELPASWS